MNYKAGEFARADELFRRLIQERPDSDWSDDARLLLAESDFFADRLEPARTAFRDLADDERSDDFVRQRSLVLLLDIGARLDDWDDVRKVAEDLITHYPDSDHRTYADYRLGEARLRGGKLAEAEQAFQALMDRRDDPTVAEAEWLPSIWLMQAEAALGLKNYDQVRITATEFTEQFPESPFQYHLDEVVGAAFSSRRASTRPARPFSESSIRPRGPRLRPLPSPSSTSPSPTSPRSATRTRSMPTTGC